MRAMSLSGRLASALVFIIVAMSGCPLEQPALDSSAEPFVTIEAYVVPEEPSAPEAVPRLEDDTGLWLVSVEGEEPPFFLKVEDGRVVGFYDAVAKRPILWGGDIRTSGGMTRISFEVFTSWGTGEHEAKARTVYFLLRVARQEAGTYRGTGHCETTTEVEDVTVLFSSEFGLLMERGEP